MDTNQKSLVDEAPICVVGIGASAGGLEAIGDLLKRLPENTGMAYVVIQHLSPDYKSMMPEILCNYTMMPVVQATDKILIERNTVYLIPPKFNMEVCGGKLALFEYKHNNTVNHPIDIFFESLAKEYEGRAIAVVLSGTGTDGTNGIRTIKEQGGVIIVQKPETAQFDGMPRSALQTGFADNCLSPEEIADDIAAIASSISTEDNGMTNEELLNKIYSILKKASNVNYTYYKKTTITRRIERRMMLNHITNMYDYVNLLRTNNDEAAELAKDVLIGVTSFFRDPECFEALKTRVILPLVNNADPEKVIRIWVAGCSTGEEAYTIAILIREAMDALDKDLKVKIFATDLDRDAVVTAGLGQYAENMVSDITAPRLARYFTKKGKTYTINRDIRKMIVFSPHNVFQDPPFGKLDLISCRNMLIYFQTVLQKDLFGIFHMALNDGGYLFLGKSETVSGFGDVYSAICPNEKIYIHNAASSVPSDLSARYRMGPTAGEIPTFEKTEPQTDDEDEEKELRLSMLEDYMPASVLIDQHNNIRHTFGSCENYLRFPRGKTEFDLFTNLVEDLRIPVSTALKKVRDSGQRMIYDNISVRGEKEAKTLSLVIAPILDRYRQPTEFTAVIFMEQNSSAAPKDGVQYDVNVAASQRISDLERELVRTQDKLKKAVTDRETANEELQAANEELLTANEELQSSNEELQSVNEELYTVNAEYQEKLSEVTALNDDISNFLSSTLIGIMFLDSNLRIRKYTNYLSREFNVMEQDIGRPVKTMEYNFINVNLEKVALDVLHTLTTEQMDIVSAAGRSYLMRVAPYRTEDNKILGIVLTFVDTTNQKSDAQQILDMEAALSHAQKTNRDKDSFLSQMSHDMRTPLNAILGSVQLAYDYVGDNTPMIESLDVIRENSEYLLSIISDILESSRLRSGTIQINPVPSNEQKMLDEVVALMVPEARRHDIELTTTCNGLTGKAIMIDKNHVKEILVNLLNNALKFTKSGGKVDFIVDVVPLAGGGCKHIYTVADTGCGISEEFQTKMFIPFERECKGKENKAQGTGLGLYIVHELVSAMGGSIYCKSTEGVGTQFVVTLEFPEATNAQIDDFRKEKVPLDYSILAGKTVMICEDNDVNMRITRRMLERAGVDTIEATNGKEAVQFFEDFHENSMDAILMDIRMPVMDGREATIAIRSLHREDAQSIPVIALTADVGEEDQQSFFAAGMNDCLCKPVQIDSVYEKLVSAIQKRQSRT